VAVESDTSIASSFRWRRAVQDAITDCIATNAPFTSDDVWARLGRRQGDPVSMTRKRALACIIRDASQARRIVKTGVTVKGRYSTGRNPVVEWKAARTAP
jgi:hypothetical protein